MTIYVLWSGGLDSTLTLQRKATNYPNETIMAVTIKNHQWNNKQFEYERLARNKLRKKLPKNIRYSTIDVTTDKIFSMSWQMPTWLCFMAPFVDNNDVVVISYLSSDGADYWSRKTEFVNAFYAIMKLQDRDAKLEFPLEYKLKGYVIQELKKLKLFKYCWYCGNSTNGKPCGKCMKCVSVKRWSAFPDKGVET